MTQKNRAVVLVFTLLGLILVIVMVSVDDSDFADVQFRLSFIWSALGSLVALLAAILLLFRAAGGAPFRELLPLVFPLLAGAVVAGTHWATAIGLALVAIALVVREMVGTPQDRR